MPGAEGAPEDVRAEEVDVEPCERLVRLLAVVE